MAELSIVDALKQALQEEMRRDETVFLLGEDEDIKGGMGGAFTVTKGFMDEFGPERVYNTPISEILIGGILTGAGMMGMRPVADLQYCDFIFCMMDSVVNQMAKMCYMSGGTLHVHCVLRLPCGATNRGAQHAQTPESYVVHCPGLKVVCPSTPYDAKGLMKTAIRDDNPVMFFEHKLLYGGSRKETDQMKVTGEVPEEEYTIEFGKAAIRREGTDVTIVANLLMSYKAQEAASILEKEGISCEIIDPRTLVPFDYETVEASVKKTGKLMIVHEDNARCGWGSDVAAHFAKYNIYDLDAPIEVVGTLDTPIPFTLPLENFVTPSVERIADAARKLAKM